MKGTKSAKNIKINRPEKDQIQSAEELFGVWTHSRQMAEAPCTK
jgi:hypothetical protein